MQLDGPHSNRMVILNFYFTIPVISEIHLVLYNHFHMDQALQLIANDERLTQPLTLDLLPTDEGGDPMAASANNDVLVRDGLFVPKPYAGKSL